ncbi:MAG: sodium:proton antiporter [Caldilineaceae bacterium]|nr:sodium:proton antiporter [Caldilineaceae bacterium]
MQTLTFATIAAFILLFGLISKRIQTTIVSAPMIFVLFGLVLSRWGLGMITLEENSEAVNVIAELTLILILFTDASRINLRELRREHNIPVRLLSFGLPLTIVAGIVAAMVLLDGINIWEAAVVAVILAPTDAALGQAVVSDRRVPVRIRQALNVESGLNDGIALPILLFVLTGADIAESIGSVAYWVQFAALQLLFGPLVGVAVGYVGAKSTQWAVRSGWMSESYLELSAVAVSLLAYSGAELIGGNGFIAAFCAGLTLGNVAPNISRRIHDFAEAGGQLLTLVTFLLFGAIMAPSALADATAPIVIYAIVSLTIVRMAPVAISQIGVRLQPGTVGFLGWFGPRGIASILYALLLLEHSGIQASDMILTTVFVTVLLSIFAHGMTAVPAASWYARYVAQREEGSEMVEHMTVSEMPVRTRYRVPYG